MFRTGRAVPPPQTRQENIVTDQSQAAHPGVRKYFILETDFSVANTSPVRSWINEAEQMVGFYPDASKPFHGLTFTELPKIRFERKGRQGALRDAAPVTLGIWLISDRVRQMVEKLDPDAFVFQKVDVDYSNFPEPGPARWFCYIMRSLDCVDEERSVIRYQQDPPGIKAYEALIDIKMKPEIVGSAHAFRLRYARSKLIVDDVIVDALNAERITGFKFKPIQK
jgi:hypothetical protein